MRPLNRRISRTALRFGPSIIDNDTSSGCFFYSNPISVEHRLVMDHNSKGRNAALAVENAQLTRAPDDSRRANDALRFLWSSVRLC